MAVVDILLNDIDAPTPIVFSDKYTSFTVTSFLRGHHAYMEWKPVIAIIL